MFTGNRNSVYHDFVDEYNSDPVNLHISAQPFFESGDGFFGNACLQLWKLQGHIAGKGDDEQENQQPGQYFS